MGSQPMRVVFCSAPLAPMSIIKSAHPLPENLWGREKSKEARCRLVLLQWNAAAPCRYVDVPSFAAVAHRKGFGGLGS